MKRLLPNSFEFDPSGPLEIPYGRYPHKKSGVTQTVGPKALAGIRARLAAAKADGAPGIPVYAGHPDVPDLAARYPDKSAKGWVTECAEEGGVMRLAVEWVESPPAPGAFIYFSPYFAGADISPAETEIDDMMSVGLTNRPNSTRFRLPNEAADEGQTNKQERGTMKKVLELLSLPETATEEEAAAAVQKLIDEKAALARKSEEAAAEAQTAAANCAEAKKGLANEREARIGLLLDCALSEGRVTPATRPVWEGRLRKDFANEAEALGKAAPALKTRSALPNEGPDGAPAGVLARYEAMPEGPEKDAFLRANARTINDARVALNR